MYTLQSVELRQGLHSLYIVRSEISASNWAPRSRRASEVTLRSCVLWRRRSKI